LWEICGEVITITLKRRYNMETVKELMHGMANDIQVITFGINSGENAVSAERMLEAAEGLADKFHLKITLQRRKEES
jgi:hypothetical protein